MLQFLPPATREGEGVVLARERGVLVRGELQMLRAISAQVPEGSSSR